ncbi:MBL fold metallo-hydrolase [Halobacillus kuroshimensis]|uniref:MBL fold metallo-hydrolase n=1 Tax=Halobacillus kuroshimensis TaxID=302481 RepID=A0ABS3E0U7_9BACI|nr:MULTISPECIES: MBL fold metallo-hydrolase [Halobacillus]MBN8237184.1 MBL fold metallo-hydrolase [Halobacillus kuroshimensis]
MFQVFEKEQVTCVEMVVPHMGSVYAYYVDGMIVDTGTRHFENELISFYERMPIDVTALTHNHEDHTGTAAWLEQHHRSPIYVHPSGIDTCTEFAPYPEYRRKTWGLREAFHPVPYPSQLSSRHLDWEVIETPGHAVDHVSLFNKDRGLLFSGDLFVRPKTKVIMREESIPQIMDSIQKVLTYDFGPMFCGHAGYIEDGRSRLEEKLDHLQHLYGEVKHLHESGLSDRDIQKKLFPKEYPIISYSDGEWDSFHIITSIVADVNARV